VKRRKTTRARAPVMGLGCHDDAVVEHRLLAI